ncbi:MAG: DUF3822 family protein [Ginsengibacter sp.]
MKTVLEILPVELDAQNCTLVFEINNEGFSYTIKDDDENVYIAAAVFHFDKIPGVDDYSIVLQNELQQHRVLSGDFKKVCIMYSFEECVLIPFSLYNSRENTNVLNLIHGDFQSNFSVLTDVITKSEIYNIYRVPAPVLNMVKSKFPYAINRHQYSVLLNQVPAEGDKLSVIFYPKKVVMMLNKNGATQFINTFSYDTADDVLYILLNACQQFEAYDIPVEISGMVEMNSPLTKEIYNHFSSVGFSELPAGSNYSEEITRHPTHYFSYLFAVDSCE